MDAVAAAGLCDSFVDVAELFGFVLSSGGPVAAGNTPFQRAVH